MKVKLKENWTLLVGCALVLPLVVFAMNYPAHSLARLTVLAIMATATTAGSLFAFLKTRRQKEFRKTKIRKAWLSVIVTRTRTIKVPPGARLFAIVEFLYSPADVEGTFEPLVADWRKEYFDAVHQDRLWKARWISIRYVVRFGQAMGLKKAWNIGREVVKVVRSIVS